MLNNFPGISVVIPTEGRVELISQLLDSLEVTRQQYPSPNEIIVIDSSPKPQSEFIRALCADHNAIYVPGDSSVRSKRNLGIRQAKYPITLFVDSDCRSASDLLQQHGRMYLQAPSIGGCAGLVQFDQDNHSFFWRMLQRTSFVFPFKAPMEMESVMWGPTANTSYRTELLNQVNGFDEKFPFKLGGDDVDIGVRVSKLGYLIVTNPQAKVVHSSQTWSPRTVISRAVRWGRMHYFLFCKHPSQRTMAMPGTLTILLLLSTLSILLSTVRLQLEWLLIPWLWWVIRVITEGILLAGTGRKPASILRDVCAGQFELFFDVGNFFEALIHGDLRPFYETFSYMPIEGSDGYESISLSERRVRQNWSIVLSLIILVIGWGAVLS